jgi:pyroglutamyl-peptidase
MRRVLITGFEPFGKSQQNPSQEAIRSLSKLKLPTVNLRCEVLPVEYSKSAHQLLSIVQEFKPEIVIALGQAEGRAGITPEKVAINLNDASIPDNAGVTVRDQLIRPTGPVAYFSTLPVNEIVKQLQSREIPASLSLSAGSFLCNHIFYCLQEFEKNSKMSSGFIHLPLMDSQKEEFPGLPTLPLEKLVQGVQVALEVTLASLR